MEEKTALESYTDALIEIKEKQEQLQQYRKDIETALVGNDKAAKAFKFYADTQLEFIKLLSNFGLNTVSKISKLK